MSRCAVCPIPPDKPCHHRHFPVFCHWAAAGQHLDLIRVRSALPAPEGKPAPASGSLAVYGYLSSWTGYGQLTGWIGRALADLGVPLHFEEQHTDARYYPRHPFVQDRLMGPQSGPVLQFAIPSTEVRPGRPTVVFTMWETDRIPREAVDQLNRTRAVVVPCAMNAVGFRASGVQVPIHVVPLGIDATEDDYQDDGRPLPTLCTFGMAGRMAHGGIRKNLNEGMRAFVDAFPPDVQDVRLLVKVWPDCLPYLDVPRDPRITILTTSMQPREMAQWYRGLTALFVPSRGEGWGLHSHQALAVGRPIIAADWGGTAAFFDPSCCVPLSYQMERSRGEMFCRGVGDWCRPDEPSMVQALQSVHHDHRAGGARLRAMGQAAARRAAEFPWARTGRELLAVLRAEGLLPGPAPDQLVRKDEQPIPLPDVLAAVVACPDRGGVLPVSEQRPGCRACELSECRAGKGAARPGAVTVQECVQCRRAFLTNQAASVPCPGSVASPTFS